jgi:hypothetical protein
MSNSKVNNVLQEVDGYNIDSNQSRPKFHRQTVTRATLKIVATKESQLRLIISNIINECLVKIHKAVPLNCNSIKYIFVMTISRVLVSRTNVQVSRTVARASRTVAQASRTNYAA